MAASVVVMSKILNSLTLVNVFIQLFTSEATWWLHGCCCHLWIKQSGFKPRPGTLCALSPAAPLSTQMNKWAPADIFNAEGQPCDVRASHPGGSSLTHNCFMLELKHWGPTWLIYRVYLYLTKLKN